MNVDFVPFEFNRQLKEKGFRELCLAYYTNDDTLYYNYSHKSGACYKDCYLSHNLMPKDSVSGKFVDAPTISQVLKWLRVEKKMHIQILFVCPPNRWEYITVKMTNNEHRGMCANFTSYEQAALAGIEYVLDNLI